MNYRVRIRNWWYYEKFYVFIPGGNLLYESDPSGNTFDEGEACLSPTTFNQYHLKISEGNDEWQANTWMEIKGPYNNVVLKTDSFISGSVSATKQFSLYTPIMKGSSWNYRSGSIPTNWYSESYDDSSWNTKNGGNSFSFSSGRLFLRRSVNIPVDLAAYEVSIKYQYGIVVYVGGEEVYRDHIPSGDITAQTVYNSYYSSLSFHNIIRSTTGITDADTKIAILLFMPSSFSSINFDAWLAVYASSLTTANSNIICYEIPDVTTSPTDYYDWDVTTEDSYNGQTIVNYYFAANIEVNGMYVSSGDNSYISKYRVSWMPSNANSYSSFTNFPGNDEGYYATTYSMYGKSFQTQPIHSYSWVDIGEWHLLSCRRSSRRSVEYASYTYEYHQGESVSTVPTSFPSGYSCSISPSLSSGLSMNSVGRISGTPTITQSERSHTITCTSTSSPGYSIGAVLDISVTEGPNAPRDLSYGSITFTKTCNEFFSITPTVIGSSITYSTTSSLPTGIGLNQNTGVISGTPTSVVTNRAITIKASNAYGDCSVTILISIVQSITGLSYGLTTFVIEKGVSFSVYPSGSFSSATFSISSGTMPSGIVLTTSSGRIHGTPSSTVYNREVTITVTNGVTTFSVDLTFTVLTRPTSLYYSEFTNPIYVNRVYSLEPYCNGDSLTYSITGTLPTGLTFNTQSGTISGNPTTVQSSVYVTVTASNDIGQKSIVLIFNVNKLTCSNGQVVTTFHRTYSIYANEESVNIKNGGNVIFTIEGTSSDNNKECNFDVCLSKFIWYDVEMEDSYGDGWSSGSNLEVLVHDEVVRSFTLAERSGSGEFCLNDIFYFGEVWRYSSIAQSNTNWITESISTWSQLSSFPDVTTITRYFRRTISFYNFINSYYIRFNTKSNAGFLMYLDGRRAWNWNMPSGTITSSTYALSSTSSPTTRSFGTYLKLWTSTDSLIVAFEVHSTSTTNYGEEPFDCRIEVYPINVLHNQIWGNPQVESNYLVTSGYITSNIFDGDVSTKWSTSHSSGDIWVTYHMSNERQETISRYILISADDKPENDPKSWSVYGSQDGSTYYLLDSRTDEMWSSRTAQKIFTINNVVPFTYYKLVVTAKRGTSNGFQLAEWILQTSDFTLPTFSLSYGQSSYTIASGQSWSQSPTIDGVMYTYAITGGSLPSGITINSSTGVISGITSSSGVYAVTITATNPVVERSCQLTLTVSAPASVYSYSQSIYSLMKEKPIYLSPAYNGGSATFSIKQGSLPVGIVIDQYSGVIHGVPTSLQSTSAVTLKAVNNVGEITVTLSFSVITFSCPSNTVKVMFYRKLQNYAREESFEVYEGSSASGTPLFIHHGLNGILESTMYYCLESSTTYTLKLMDSYGDAWTNESYLKVSIDNYLINKYHLEQDFSSTYSLIIPQIRYFGQSWRYSNSAQEDQDWTTGSVTHWSNTASFPSVTTITRYFRSTVSINDFANTFYCRFIVRINTGFIMYLNGLQAWSYNMPASGVTSLTYALSNTGLFTKIFGTFLKLWTTTSSLTVAFEVHATSATRFGDEPFDCQILFGKTSSSLSTVVPYSTYGSSTLSNLVDGVSTTEWAATSWDIGNVNLIIHFNGDEETINQYSIMNSSDDDDDPSDWTVSGSLDGNTYYLLESRSSVSWSTRKQTKSFSLSNVIPYKYYKFSFSDNSGLASNALRLSEFTLSTQSSTLPTVSLSYPASSIIKTKGDYINACPTISGVGYSYSYSGLLPYGVELNSETGCLVGYANSAMIGDLTITAHNRIYTKSFTIMITIIGAPTVFTYNVGPCNIAINSPFSISPVTDGNLLTYSIQSGSLPTGLTLNSQTGEISGTPTSEVTSQTVTIRALNSAGSNTVSITFTVYTPLNPFSYPQTSYSFTKGSAVMACPIIEVTGITFSIQSGFLPSGLYLDAASGCIMGAPSMVNSATSVTIQAASGNQSSQTTTISFTITEFTCTSDKVRVQLYREYSSWAGEESFKLFEGSTATGTPLLAVEGSYLYNNQIMNYKLCLDRVEYTIQVKDSMRDNWSGGSMLSVSYDDIMDSVFIIEESYTWEGTLYHLYPPPTAPISDGQWQYSNNPQSNESWKVDSITWPSLSSFPSVTATTRYYRRTIQFPSYAMINYLIMGVYTKTGFIMYLNGRKAMSYNMPTTGTITSSTYALSASVYWKYMTMGTYLKLWTDAASLTIAVEVHSTATTRSDEDMFSMIIAPFHKNHHVVIPTQFLQPSFIEQSLSPSLISPMFDHSMMSYFSNDHTLPLWISFQYSNGPFAFNGYSIARHSGGYPTEWKLYGSLDGETYYELDSQSNVVWNSATTMEEKTFAFYNVISFQHYKLVISEIDNSSPFRIAEWTMFSADALLPEVVLSYNQPASGFNILANSNSWSCSPTILGVAYSFAVTSGVLPAGLSINAITGVISGTPTVPTLGHTVTVTATNPVYERSTTLTLNVLILPSNLVYSETAITLTVGQNYTSNTPTVTGNAVIFSVSGGNLPADLSLNSQTGVISGTADTQGTCEMTITASNNVGSTSTSLTITILPAATTFSYPQNSYPIIQNSYFSTGIPTYNGNDGIFSIKTGTLPAGLFIESTTGEIFGVPSASFSSQTVVIKAVNAGSELTVSLTFASTTLSCTSNQYLVTMKRQYNHQAVDNAWSIHEGSSANNAAVVTVPGKVQFNNQDMTVKVCLQSVSYAIYLQSPASSECSSANTLVIVIGDHEYKHFQVCTGSITHVITLPQVIDFGSYWQYSNAVQSSPAWTTNSVSWQNTNTFNPITTITRYFRSTITVANFQSTSYIRLNVKDKTGFLMYLNGKMAWNHNMPADTSTITSSTTALSTSPSIEHRSFGTFLKLWTTSATVVVAFEVHATQAAMTGEETFDCQIILYPQTSDLRMVYSDATVISNPMTIGATGSNKVFDNDVNTKWSANHSGTVWVDIEYPNDRRETVNKYSIANADDIPNRDPKSWKLLGSLDGDTYYELDSQTGATWTTRKQVKTFTINNMVAFKHYKLEISQRSGDNNAFQFAELNLLSSQPPGTITPIQVTYSTTAYSGNANIPISITPTVSGTTFTFSILSGTLPTGLNLNSNTGVISGTPTSGTNQQEVIVKASSLLYSAQFTFTFTIISSPTSFTYPQTTYSMIVGNSINAIPTVNSEISAYSILSGTLPTGLTLNQETGVISGTATVTTSAAGNTVVVKAANSAGHTTTTITIIVTTSLLNFQYPQSTYSIALNTAFTATPSIEGTATGYTIQSGSLPSGLLLNQSSGEIYGSPSTACSGVIVTIKAADAYSSTTVVLTFNVIAPPTEFSYSQTSFTLTVGSIFSSTPIVNTQPPLTYSITSGALPANVTLNTSSGVISGTPTTTTSSAMSVTLKVSNIAGYKTVTLSFLVLTAVSSFTYPQSSYTIQKGVAFSTTPTVLGTLLTYSIYSGSLPTGLTLNAQTGAITGTPTQSVTDRSVTIRVSNDVGEQFATISMTVIAAPTTFSYPQATYTVAKGNQVTLQPTTNGDNVMYSIQSGSLPAGLSLNEESGVISGSPSTSTTNQIVVVKVSNQFGSKEFTLTLTVVTTITLFSYPQASYVIARNSAFTATPTSNGDSRSFSVKSGVLPPGLSLNPSTGVISGTPQYNAADVVVVVEVQNAVSSLEYSITFTILLPPSTLTYSSTTFTRKKGSEFNETPVYSGDQVTFEVASGTLPGGLTINTSTGQISGTATASVQATAVTIRVYNILGSHTVTLIFTIQSEIITFAYSSTKFVIAKSEPFTSSPTVTGEQYGFIIESGSLPFGLSLDTALGTISGTPTTYTSSHNVTIKVSNLVSHQSVIIEFVVLTKPTTFSYFQTVYTIAKGVAITENPTFNGEQVTFSISSGSLPQGLSVHPSSGVISGTPTTVSSTTATMLVKNDVGEKTVGITFHVLELITSFNYPESTYSIAKAVSFSAIPSIIGSSPTYSVHSGSLPTGLAINESTGVISGTPSVAGNSIVVTLKVENELSSKTMTLTFNVIAAPTSLTYSGSPFTISVGSAFSTMAEVDTTSSLTYSIVTGQLPPGLSINESTGEISGTPTTATTSPLSITVKASNLAGEKRVTISLSVIASVSTFTYPESLYVIEKGKTFSALPEVSGSHLSFVCQSGTLPTGLTLNSSTGKISGTPIQSVSSRTVTIAASNEINTLTAVVTFTVLEAPTTFSYSQSSYAIAQGSTFSISPSVNGDNLSYEVKSGSLPSGLTLSANTGVISGTPSTSVSSSVVVIKVFNQFGSMDCSLTFNVILSITSFTYPQLTYVIAIGEVFTVTPTTSGDSITYSIKSGTLPAGLSLNTGTGVISGTPSEAVTSAVVVVKASNEFSSVEFTITLTVLSAPPAISYIQAAYTIVKGSPFSALPSSTVASTTSVAIQSGSLPTGLLLNPSTGEISGTPTQSTSNMEVVIRAFNIAGESTTTLTFTVLEPPASLTYTQSTFIIAMDESFSTSAQVSGIAVTYSVQSGVLPTGLTLNPTTGEISGTPTVTVTSVQVVIQASNLAGTTTVTLSFTVMLAPSSLSYSQLTFNQVRNTEFSISPTVSGDGLTFGISNGSLPAGLSIDGSTGVISGTPTDITSGEGQVITVKASNAVGEVETDITIAVYDQPTSLSYPEDTYLIAKNDAFSTTPLFDGSSTTFSIQSGSLPAGLTLNPSSGVITGAPTEVVMGRNVVIRVSNPVGSVTTTLTFSVLTRPSNLSYPQPTYNIAKNEEFSATPEITGNELQYTLVTGQLPLGLELNANTGVISGIPTACTSRTLLVIRASNALGETTVIIQITVMQLPNNFEYPAKLITIPIGEQYSLKPISLEGDDLDISTEPALPSGLMVNNKGEIYGIPNTPTEMLTIVITASNAVGSTSATLIIRIMTSPSDFKYPQSVYSLIKGTAFSVKPEFKGENVKFSVTSSQLPSGLVLNANTGEISGIPNEKTKGIIVEITATNEVSSTSLQLVFAVKTMSTSTIVVIVVVVVLLVLLVGAAIILLITGKIGKFNTSRKKSSKNGGRTDLSDV